MSKYLVIILLAIFFIACNKSEVSRGPRPLQPGVPANFPAWPDISDNPMTVEGVELGRKLFYDKRLSGLNNLSCASCHKQELAFSDGVALNDIGASGMPLHRNSPALFNLVWTMNGLFWDGGATNLESQAFAPITSPDEMHQNLFQLVDELKQDPEYKYLFQLVFDDTEIRSGNIAKAIAQFQRTLISADSRYDKFIRNEPGGWLSSEETRGSELFQQKCAGCHGGALFTDNKYHNNGLDSDFSNDAFEGIYMGRYRITNNHDDIGKFKTPTLRNIMLTAPYMHDGRFSTLMEVLNHYSAGIKLSATLDVNLKNETEPPGILLTPADKEALISFLKTLTDSSFIRNKNFSSPN